MSTLKQSRLRPWLTMWWIVVAILIARLFPFVAQPGLAMDGTIYAAVARNMAAGFGDFWHPAFSPGAGALYPAFSASTGAHYYEHPPLAYFLESCAFRILGDHFWVEKLYSAATGILTIIIVAAIWRRLVGKQSQWAEYSWLPIVLWLVWPHWTRQYVNNWLENTAGVFTTFAIYCALRATDKSRNNLRWIALGSLSVLAAVLSKGPLGLFPLITPLVAWATLRRQSWRRAAAENAAWLFFFSAAFALILLQPAARECLNKYFNQQLIASLSGRREHASQWGHLFILNSMMKDLWLPLLVAMAVLMVDHLRRRFIPPKAHLPSAAAGSANLNPPILFCLATAASASLPIIVSPKQFDHYAYPAFPFVMLAAALWCVPAIVRLRYGWQATFTTWIHRLSRSAAYASVAASAVISIAVAGQPCTDQERLHDVDVLRRLVPSASVIGISAPLANDVSLHAYLSRCGKIGVDPADLSNREYYLAERSDAAPAPAGYLPVPSEMVRYRLYQSSPAAGIYGNNHDRAVNLADQMANHLLR